jgi:hypothetical protein
MEKVKRAILGIAIALILVFFVAYAIQSIYPGPEYGDFCGRDLPPTPVEDQEACESYGGGWNSEVRSHSTEKNVIDGWCNLEFTCGNEYEALRESYERNVFFVNVGLGVIIILFSFFISVGSVSTGLMGGGVILIVYGTIRYWGSLSDWLRTLMLGATLAVMIWIGYKKLKN